MRARLVLVPALTLSGLSVLAAMQAAGPQTRPDTLSRAAGYSVDGVHSSVVFRIQHLGVSYFYGRFNSPRGTIAFDPENPTACSFEVELESAAVDTGNDKRDNHLRSPDFFSASEFPRISFKSTGVTRRTSDTFEVAGALTLHGKTRPITIQLEQVGCGETPQGYRCGFETTFTIKRSDYGMTYMQGGGLGDEVTLMVGLEAVRK